MNIIKKRLQYFFAASFIFSLPVWGNCTVTTSIIILPGCEGHATTLLDSYTEIGYTVDCLQWNEDSSACPGGWFVTCEILTFELWGCSFARQESNLLLPRINNQIHFSENSELPSKVV